MAVITISTPNGVFAYDATLTTVTDAGGAVVDRIMVVPVVVQSDASGNFSYDISRFGFKSVLNVTPTVITGLTTPVTNASLANSAEAKIANYNTSTVTGYVTRPLTVGLVGTLAVQLTTTPLSVMLLIVGVI